MFRRWLSGLSLLFDGFAYGYGTTREPVIPSVPYIPRAADRVRSGRERMVC